MALQWCRDLGINTVSGYLWSTENWRRPVDEVQYMRLLLRTYGPSFARQLHEQQIRIVHSGSVDGLTSDEQAIIADAVSLTQANRSLVFNLVFNSSGRADLVQVARRLVHEQVVATQIDEQTISDALATAGLPEIDFVIRTAGEQRLSNFLLWQTASAQVHAVTTYWPALTRHEFEHAISKYRPPRSPRSHTNLLSRRCVERQRSVGVEGIDQAEQALTR
jgi:undecaprenyl diphosphate synthase